MPGYVVTDLDIDVTARTVYGEARGEAPAGMLAVGFVIVRRRGIGRWGPTLVHVCLARKQFSCWNEGDPNLKLLMSVTMADPRFRASMKAVMDVLNGAPDNTSGADHYHTTSMQPPNWADRSKRTAVLGGHAFYRLET